MLSDLQLLSFEVGDACNFAGRHPRCPVNDDRRHAYGLARGPGASLADQQILGFAAFCQARGFRGLVAYHYYNEPLLCLERVRRLAAGLAEIGLQSLLWTNGALLAADTDLSPFARVCVTEHDPQQAALVRDLAERWPGRVKTVRADMDDRLDIYAAEPCAKAAPCFRPSRLELAVDYYGALHLCCADWCAWWRIGSVHDEDWPALLARWEESAAAAMAGDAEICRRCQSLPKSPALLDGGYRL